MSDTPPAPPVRNLFATKTAFAQYVMGALIVWPDGAAWIGTHVQLVMGVFILGNLLMRKATHGKVEFFPSSVTDGV